MTEKITRSGTKGFIETSVGVYTFDIAAFDKLAQPAVLPFYTQNTLLMPMQIGGFNIIPMGEENNYPLELRKILDDNNLTPELLKKKQSLLWGQGPALYKIVHQDGNRSRYFEENKDIMAWLKTWDWEEYLRRVNIEYSIMEGYYTKFYRNRGVRLGQKGVITELKMVSNRRARLEWPDDYGNINHIITGNYQESWRYGLTSYPIWDKHNPFAFPVAMRYSNLYNFAMNFEEDYARSSFHGSINWIKLASSIAILLMNYNINSAAIKWHIESPAAYWEIKKGELQAKCESLGKEYNDKMLEKVIDDTLKKIANALSGIEKAGKFVHTQTMFDINAGLNGEYVGWKFTPLDQKVKDFIDAQINIAKHALFEATAGLGLHAALSNITLEGNLPSGSEQLYAFKLYLMTGIDIPESIICKDLNDAIQINFPDTEYRVGFYHDVVITESQTAPADRTANKGNQVNISKKPINTKAVDKIILDINTRTEDNIVGCLDCHLRFDYNSVSVSGLGHVNCPRCGAIVTQND